MRAEVDQEGFIPVPSKDDAKVVIDAEGPVVGKLALRDLGDLTPTQRRRFATAFERFDADLAKGRFRTSLRVKRVEGTDSIFEMTWAPDGRATFQYGDSQGVGAQVVWRRIGTHKVFKRP